MRSKRIPISQDIIDTIRREQERTTVGSFRLLRGKRKELPSGLNSSIIQSWLSGNAKTAKQEHVDYALQLWRELPDLQRPAPIKRMKHGEPRPGYVRISEEDRQSLFEYREKSYTPAILFKLIEGKPKGLTSNIISSWTNAQAEFARKDYLEFVLEGLKVIEAHPERPVVIDEKLWQKLVHYRKETGLGGKKLLDRVTTPPEGLTPLMISSWQGKTTKTARRDHLDFVLKLYESTLTQSL